MARTPRRILPFRVPFFRIFYSTTYTTIYIICLAFLAITPVSMMWQSIVQLALQYVVMLGGTYVLTATIAIFVYASRVFTNRTIMAGVGKPYVQIEPGEVGKKVRKMIVTQLERSAIIAWESRPRDLVGEILQAEQHGFLPHETMSAGANDYIVGREIPIDPAAPPWGDVQHAGWSSPARRGAGETPNVQFAPVVQELPNLIEAKAVSLAPPDPLDLEVDGDVMADPAVVDVLRRPETMGLRDYLTQLSYLGLINPPSAGQTFLNQYEHARFGGLPLSEAEFKRLMNAFSELLAGMIGLEPTIIEQIRLQTGDLLPLTQPKETARGSPGQGMSPVALSRLNTPASSIMSPVTARTGPPGNGTPYLTQASASKASLNSVIQHSPCESEAPVTTIAHHRSSSPAQSEHSSQQSESGSVLRYAENFENG